MKSFTRFVVCSHWLLAGITLAQAQTVYRCGNSYSQIPCEGAVTVKADDARSDEQRNDARQALSKDKALAHELETRRRQEEAAALATTKAPSRTASVQQKQAEKVLVAPKTWIRTDVPRTLKKSRASKSTKAREKPSREPKRSQGLAAKP